MKLAAFQLKTRPPPETGEAGIRSARYRKDRTVPELFAEQVDAAPDAVAIIHDDVHTTYRELDDRATALARWLIDRGVGHEALVAMKLPRSVEAIVAMLGVLKAGAAYLPLGDDVPLPRLRRILTDSRATVLIGQAEDMPFCRALRADAPDLHSLLFLDRVDPSVLSDGEFDLRALDRHAGVGRLDRSRAGGLAYVMYTSGTTGAPKGVMIEHHAILRLVIDTDYVQFGPADRFLQTGALSFDASTFEIWGALLNGAALCVPRHDELLDPDALTRLIRHHGITTLWVTTGLFNTLTTARPDLPEGLRMLFCGGERQSPLHINRVRRRFPELVLKSAYGPTENATFTTIFDVREECTTDVPIGWPIARTSVYLLDDRLRPVPDGVQGELYTGGEGLARGYLNDPALTAARFIASPFAAGQRLYRTGDLARRRPDGALEFLGRIDNQVKIRGFRIEPAEIEHRIAQLPGVREVIVTARGEQAEERFLVAYYTAEQEIPADQLRRHVAEALPEPMIPAHFVHLSAMPLAASGKFDRRALPAAAAPSRTTAADDAVGETEQILLSIWREALQRDDIGRADDFFELGGHSLKAVKLVHLIDVRLGISLPFTIVYQATTVRAMAARILDAARTGEAAIDLPLISLTSGAAAPLLYAFPPGTADALSYAELARRLNTHAIRAFNFCEAAANATQFADLILDQEGSGPYCLFGYSGGGNLAFRTALELERRGKTVSDVVLLDASRFLDKFEFPDGEARRLALDFIGADAVKAYIRSAPLRDKIIQRIERYYRELTRVLDDGLLQADIHLIACEDGIDEYRDDDGRLVSSKRAWADATRGRFTMHTGWGPHERMLLSPYIEGNVRVLTDVLAGIVHRPTGTA